jgi:hypothetical protein
MAKGKTKPNRKNAPNKNVITRTIRINQVLGSATAASTVIYPTSMAEMLQVFNYYNNVKYLRASLKYHSLCGADTQGGVYLAISTAKDWDEAYALDEDSKLAWIASGGTVTAARSGASVTKVFKDIGWAFPVKVENVVWGNNGDSINFYVGTTGTTADLLLGHLEIVITMEVTGQQQVHNSYSTKVLGSTNIQHSPEAEAPHGSGESKQEA